MQFSVFSISSYFPRAIVRGLVLFATALLLAACGGGGGDGDSGGDGGSGSGDLVINAGPDATVTEGVTYTLSAQVSGGDGTYTYNWSASPSLSIISPLSVRRLLRSPSIWTSAPDMRVARTPQ